MQKLINNLFNRFRLEPNFLIIGVQKGGTTSLYQYLSSHPLIDPSKKKEIHFFDQDSNFMKGYSWYNKHFPLKPLGNKETITFEATPAYIYFPFCPERIWHYNPKMKLILILRDPVERAFSQWNMFRNFQNSIKFNHLSEKRSFDEVVAIEIGLIKQGSIVALPEQHNYVRRGIFIEQIERYLQYFPRDQIFIAESTAFRANKSIILSEITEFLGLPPYEWERVRAQTKNTGKYTELKMSTGARRLLADFYRPYNEKLFKFLGKRYDWS